MAGLSGRDVTVELGDGERREFWLEGEDYGLLVEGVADPCERSERLVEPFLLQGVTTAFVGNDGGGPTDVGALTRAVSAEFAPALDKHDSTLAVRLRDERIEAVCDPERVAQVLRILIDNALTHTPVGTGVVVSAVRDALAAQASRVLADRASTAPLVTA